MLHAAWTTRSFSPGGPASRSSASYLVDARGRAHLLAMGEQEIRVVNGQYAYLGGRIPSSVRLDDRALVAALASVPGLHGFVGIDFLHDPHGGRITVLEINPRPTTSLVGLTRLLPPGRLASAWIGAFRAGQ